MGANTRPWEKTSHVIHFNADLFAGANYLWWDPSPSTDGDQPFEAWDALSLARHELGHILGFNSTSYRDEVDTPSEFRLWEDRMTMSGPNATFDQGGMDTAMASSSNFAHIKDSGAMAGDLMVPAMPNSVRRDISDMDLDMLTLAYDYTHMPEPGVMGLVAAAILFGAGRRRRVGVNC